MQSIIRCARALLLIGSCGALGVLVMMGILSGGPANAGPPGGILEPLIVPIVHPPSHPSAMHALGAIETAQAERKTKRRGERQAKRKKVPEPPNGDLPVINLNQATVEELRSLPGVGPKKAVRIVLWRRRNRGFRRVSQLRQVRGFGRKTVKKLKPRLRVD